jgi:hypothetical protein
MTHPTQTRSYAILIGACAVSAYGLGVEAFWQGLLSGRSGIGAMPAVWPRRRCAAPYRELGSGR